MAEKKDSKFPYCKKSLAINECIKQRKLSVSCGIWEPNLLDLKISINHLLLLF